MLLPIPWAIYYRENLLPLLFASLITVALGLLMDHCFNQQEDKGLIRYREAFALVTLGWILASAFGSLPYLFSGTIDSLANAYYETMSGFTTTGASILTNVEVIPKSILFWRSLTHWLGGMGIIVLLVALLSQLGVGANQIFRAEVPGTGVEKITPRVAETARILWLTYVIMSLILAVLLWLAGMNLFDSLCHTFATMATGGFSTRNLSVGYYNPTIQWIITVFMFLAGANFALYFQALRGRTLRGFWKDPEFKLYAAIVLIATLMVAFTIRDLYPFGEPLIRTSLFQVVSIITTTGYASVDFGVWAPTGQLILLLLMFIGGCSGSTSGSVKVGRLRIILKQAANELKRLIHPGGVFTLRFGDRTITDEVCINVLQFFSLYILIFTGASVLLTSMGIDYLTAFTAVASNLGNVGPGLGTIGPAGNYSALPDAAKWLLSLVMLLGRLEIFTVLVLISPAFWRR
ncbi:MAG: TrkH family potassium uptake protein [Syntrophomonadaceae bacterium]|nr:TrkH family potassium uptake protein [Syntrophomonadaceae bacterium]